MAAHQADGRIKDRLLAAKSDVVVRLQVDSSPVIAAMHAICDALHMDVLGEGVPEGRIALVVGLVAASILVQHAMLFVQVHVLQR